MTTSTLPATIALQTRHAVRATASLARRQLRLLGLLAGLTLGLGCAAAAPAGAAATAPTATEAMNEEAMKLALPDVEIRDQSGAKRRFVTDLVKGRTVAVNFIFTSCTSICSPLTANFKALQTELSRRAGSNVQLISVSVDPLTDTPEELRKFAQPFDIGPGWSFVTGSRASIDAILKAFGVANADPNDHTPVVFLGHEPSGRWTRASGLASPEQLARRLGSLSSGTAQMRDVATRQAQQARIQKAAPGTKGADYFTNLPLLTHDRGRVRFYDDLIRDRVVLVSSFYASCKDVCSPLTYNLVKTQQLLEESLPNQVRLVSISTDPVADSEAVLRDYARRHGTLPGWSFVTGKKENVDWVLHKLGLYEEDKVQHSVALWVGNDRTGTWLKLHAMAPPEAIVAAVRKVL